MGSFGTGLSEAVCLDCGGELTDELSCTECAKSCESQQQVGFKRMKSKMFEDFDLNDTTIVDATAVSAVAVSVSESEPPAAKRKRKLK